MVKFIKLTNIFNINNPRPVYLNIEMIGDISRYKENITKVGILTHNNGGWNVSETPEEILELIKKANNE